MIKVNDRILRIALPAIPCGLFLYEYFLSGSSSTPSNIIYIITVLLVCEISRWFINQSRIWFREPFKNLKRSLLLLPSGILSVTVIFVISKALRNYLAFGDTMINGNYGFTLHFNEEQVKLGLIGTSFFYAVFSFLFLWAIYELAYHFARLKFAEKQRDKLEKEKLQAELQQLKGIVNPHFLFNNLNSLSSLISENPAQAENFLDELTRVFRYLLRNNETELTELSKEVQFIHSYFHLLQTRYGQAISLDMDIDQECESYLLPPLTLQLLVENAVKHNRVHRSEPLVIRIFSDPDKRLVVRNNLLQRENRLESTGIGLKSINSRYHLLGHNPLEIRKDPDHFDVIIPLIPSSASVKVIGSGALIND